MTDLERAYNDFPIAAAAISHEAWLDRGRIYAAWAAYYGHGLFTTDRGTLFEAVKHLRARPSVRPSVIA